MADLLSVGRQAFEGITRGYGRIGLSVSSRQQLESFYSSATSLFNQLYARTENSELFNVVTIKALRSKYSYLVSDEIKANDKAAAEAASNTVPASTTSGTNVDTQA